MAQTARIIELTVKIVGQRMHGGLTNLAAASSATQPVGLNPSGGRLLDSAVR